MKTGISVEEAKQLCPHLLLVEARPKLYVEYHHRIVEAVNSCVPVANVMSVDEMACRLMGRERALPNATTLAVDIKQALRTEYRTREQAFCVALKLLHTSATNLRKLKMWAGGIGSVVGFLRKRPARFSDEGEEVPAGALPSARVITHNQQLAADKRHIFTALGAGAFRLRAGSSSGWFASPDCLIACQLGAQVTVELVELTCTIGSYSPGAGPAVKWPHAGGGAQKSRRREVVPPLKRGVLVMESAQYQKGYGKPRDMANPEEKE